jgi:hypothetical protein
MNVFSPVWKRTVVCLFFGASVGCGGGSPPAPAHSAQNVQETGEDWCRRAQDPTALKVCRAELKLRIARKDAPRTKLDCYDDRIGEIHAADRQRLGMRQQLPDRVLVGVRTDDDSRRIADSERRISELWDQIQNGACD